MVPVAARGGPWRPVAARGGPWRPVAAYGAGGGVWCRWPDDGRSGREILIAIENGAEGAGRVAFTGPVLLLSY